MQVQIEKLDHFGRGICYFNEKICFIENALPREVVEINIIKETKKYRVGTPTKIIKTSPDRITPQCKYATICGGCQLQHISFEAENKFKVLKVKEIMKKFANIAEQKVKEIISDQPNHYRNKITLHVKNKKIGLYQKESNDLVEVDKCLLLDSLLNQELPKLQEKTTKSTKNITMRIGNDTKEIMTTIGNNSNKQHITSKIGNKSYLVSPNSFFQINKVITTRLYEEIKQLVIDNNSQHVLDLYCGTGTISIFISDNVTKVLGIESCQAAIEDANKNKEKNNCHNCTFRLGKVEELTEEVTNQYDTVIVDPPRNGLDKKVTEKLLEITPVNIIYVSCDPITLARDLNELKQKYEIKYIQPYNMFPRTYHVECVCVMKLR